MKLVIQLSAALLVTAATAGAVPCHPKQSIQRAPCEPAPESVESVMTAIDAAMDAQSRLQDAVISEQDSRAAALSGNYDALESWNSDLETLTRHQNEAQEKFGEAMTLLQDTYGIQPPRASGRISGGEFDGAQAQWEPRMWSQAATVYEIERKDHSLYFLKGLPNAQPSAIRDNADVYVSLRLFQNAAETRDPRRIALELQFEVVRFDGLLGGEWKNPRALQKAAFEKEMQAARAMGLDEAEVEEFQREWQRVINTGDSFPSPVSFTTPQESVTNSNVWRTEVAAQRKRMQKQLTAERNDRLAWEMLENWTKTACREWDGENAGAIPKGWPEWRNEQFMHLKPRPGWVNPRLVMAHLPCSDYVTSEIVEERNRVAAGISTRMDESWIARLVREGRAQDPDSPKAPFPLGPEILEEILVSFARDFCTSPDRARDTGLRTNFRDLPNFANTGLGAPPTVQLPPCETNVFYRLWYLKRAGGMDYDPNEMADMVRHDTDPSPANPPSPSEPPNAPTSPPNPSPIAEPPEPRHPPGKPQCEPCLGGSMCCPQN